MTSWIPMIWVLFTCSGHTGKRDRVQLQLDEIRIAIRLFYARTGTIPTAFAQLVDAGILEAIPQDPWGEPYLFSRDGGLYEIKTLGADGMRGGQGQDADLSVSFRLAGP